MADVIATLKIMPENPGIDLAKVESEAKEKCAAFGADVGKVQIEPVAFGLKALILILVYDEKKGGTDALEEIIGGIPGVNSCETTDVRRAIG